MSSKDRPRTQKRCIGAQPNYPNRQSFDAGRRRFLRQVGVTSGAGLVASFGLPRLAHGQSVDVDFSILDAHPLRATEAPLESPAAPMMPPALQPPSSAFAAPTDDPAPTPSPDPVDEPGGTGLIAGDPDEDVVVEDRALWIEPGYLVLMRLARDAEDVTVGADVDGATQDVSAYITAHLADYDSLHTLDVLHTHEDAIAAIIEARIEPAHIVALHVDHDCNEVCSGGDPYWDDIPMPGLPMPIEY